ncbi:MAG: response regulator, partial [Holophaga sp.]|nr:response regulator [Holophaga sp.]
AMPANGTLTLRTRNLDDDWIEVQVEDTGSGMSQEVLEKALDPFFTTKEPGKGTGLGLSIAHSTVSAHHGRMEIQSEPGRGTTISLRFPACDPAVMESEVGPLHDGEISQASLLVLLVDDDELIQGSMQTILETLGHTVVIASSGEAALAKIDDGLEPEVVILDMNMPGLGGAGTLQCLRVARPRVPILLATGRADQMALDLVDAYSLVTLMPKPFSIKELQKHLEPLRRR